jgi:glycosyltransferase involved in cell wall biosynthesis
MAQIAESLPRVGTAVDVVTLNQVKFRVDPLPAGVAAVDIDTSSYFRAAFWKWRRDMPMLVARFYSKRFERLLRDRLRAGRYDVIHLEGQFLLPYVPAIRRETRAPIVLRAQNVEFRIWNGWPNRLPGFRPRRCTTSPARSAPGKRPISMIATPSCRSPRKTSATSASSAPPSHRSSCRAGIDTRAPVPAAKVDPHRGLLHRIDALSPNQEAVRWLADEAWPRVLALEPRARLTVAGSGFPADLREYLVQRAIDVAADVPDVRTFSAPFRAMLAPLFSGSGMRIKVLEAMSLGKPVIATPLGAGGIEVTSGESILLAADPAELAQHVVRCMNDDALAERIGSAARALVVERYDAMCWRGNCSLSTTGCCAKPRSRAENRVATSCATRQPRSSARRARRAHASPYSPRPQVKRSGHKSSGLYGRELPLAIVAPWRCSTRTSGSKRTLHPWRRARTQKSRSCA